ncbi:MAG: hypothetical protein O6924_03685 [Alphaproteobacteria bacterium]|nr:hypothetical protein [Alphaproteobacteria bacterium]
MSNGDAALNPSAVRRTQPGKIFTLVGALGTFVLFFSAFDAAAETKIIFGAYADGPGSSSNYGGKRST